MQETSRQSKQKESLLTPSTHVFFGTGLSSTTPSSCSPAVRFFPFDDSLPVNGLLTSRADGVNSIDDPIIIILLAIGVVDKAAFASREPSTARRFMGDETASIVFPSSSKSREEGIFLNKQNQSAAREKDTSRPLVGCCVSGSARSRVRVCAEESTQKGTSIDVD